MFCSDITWFEMMCCDMLWHDAVQVVMISSMLLSIVYRLWRDVYCKKSKIVMHRNVSTRLTEGALASLIDIWMSCGREDWVAVSAVQDSMIKPLHCTAWHGMAWQMMWLPLVTYHDMISHEMTQYNMMQHTTWYDVLTSNMLCVDLEDGDMFCLLCPPSLALYGSTY